MVKHATLILFIFYCIQAKAQITITDSDMPVTGNPYYIDNAANDSIIDLSVTGANQTWDYSQLTIASSDTVEYATVASTPVLYQFYFNNIILYNDWKADLALPTADLAAIPGSPITITDVINYYKVTPSAFYQVGFGATINSVPASQRYDPRDKLLKLPNTFGLIDSNDFQWLFVIPTIAAYGQTKTRTNETDGWGTLILPNGSFNTLRVKSTVAGIDTFHIDQFNFGLAFPSTQYEYRWYANGEGEPVLTVNATQAGGNTTVTSARFKHIEPVGIYQYNGLSENVKVGPNPVSDELYIHYTSQVNQKITVSIYDISGKQVFSDSGEIHPQIDQAMKYNISGLSKGYYTLKVQGIEGVFGRKLVVY